MAKKVLPVHPGGGAFWMNIQARVDLETAEEALAPQNRKVASYQTA